MDGGTLAITLLLSTEIVVALVALAYIVRAHRPIKGESPFLDRLVARDVRVVLAGAVIGAVIVYSLLRFAVPQLNLGPLLAPWGAILVGVPLFVMLLGPILDAVQFYRERPRP